MKKRESFVSNSSSSSYIIRGSSVKDIALAMHLLVIEDCREYGGDNDCCDDQILTSFIKEVLDQDNIKSGDIGIVIPSCNYDTYILQNDDAVMITTSWNHDWNNCWPDTAAVFSYGEDDPDNPCIQFQDGKLFQTVYGDRPLIVKGLLFSHDDVSFTCPKCENDQSCYVLSIDGEKYCPWHYVKMKEVTGNPSKKID